MFGVSIRNNSLTIFFFVLLLMVYQFYRKSDLTYMNKYYKHKRIIAY